MKNYEFVALIDPNMSQDDIKSIISNIEEKFGDSIKEKDDIGFLDLAYKIKGNDRAYFVSYHINESTDIVDKLNKEFKLNTNLLRYFFYKLDSQDGFLKFHEINKQFEESEEAKNMKQNKGAFQDLENSSKS